LRRVKFSVRRVSTVREPDAIQPRAKTRRMPRWLARCTFLACSCSTRSGYRHELTGKWVKARYVAELHEIRARYKNWETIGAPEIRQHVGGSFNPWRSPSPTPRRPRRWPVVGVAT